MGRRVVKKGEGVTLLWLEVFLQEYGEKEGDEPVR